MPNFDCGAYFLTTLVPIRTDAISDSANKSGISPIHELRSAIAKLPTAMQSPLCNAHSPFARSKRLHFSRLVVIDDVAYVGRKPINALLTVLTELFLPAAWHINPVNPQPQDHLANPFLLFSADFDAASGDDSERDSFLIDLWDKSQAELSSIFKYCYDFEKQVHDGPSFAKYIARCQVETTMPFHDYFMDGVPLDALPEISNTKLLAALFGPAFLVYALVYWGYFDGAPSFFHTLFGLIAGTIVGALVVYFMVTKAGAKSYPPAPDSTLPSVLKALHLRKNFTRFVIDNQLLSVSDEPASQKELYDRFAAFTAANKPNDLDGPTQEPGVVGT
jgi:hypothetical protein